MKFVLVKYMISLTGYLNFVHYLVFWTEHNILDSGSVSVIRYKGREHQLSRVH
jgi:hypothetical protein